MMRSIRRRLVATLFVLSSTLVFCASANAETIQLGGATGTEIFHDGALVRPASFDVDQFISAVAGTVTLSIQRIEWGDLFSQLSTTVSLTSRPTLKFSGNALVTFDVTAGESFATSIYAEVAGPLGYSAYGLDVLFLPKMSQVPLPAAGWLLLSGIGALAGVRRRRVAPARA